MSARTSRKYLIFIDKGPTAGVVALATEACIFEVAVAGAHVPVAAGCGHESGHRALFQEDNRK